MCCSTSKKLQKVLQKLIYIEISLNLLKQRYKEFKNYAVRYINNQTTPTSIRTGKTMNKLKINRIIQQKLEELLKINNNTKMNNNKRKQKIIIEKYKHTREIFKSLYYILQNF